MARKPIRPIQLEPVVPGEPPKPADASKGILEGRSKKLVCVVCSKLFERSANNRKKAKVCTPFEFKHQVKYEKTPDGVVKKVPCACCRCLYKKTMSKNRTLDGKLIPLARIPEFLQLTGKFYPEVLLAFRVGLNAMLRVTELASLSPKDLELDSKPLPRLKVMALKKSVKMFFPVDLDSKVAAEIQTYIGSRSDGVIFDVPVRTLQHKFKQVVKKLGLGHLSIHCLRHTGISSRARQCKTMDELNYLRVQARHDSIETTKLYMGFEDSQRVDMAKRITWF